MARIKGGLGAKKRHNRTLKLAKGYRGARSKQYRVAKQSVMRALTSSYAYTDRVIDAVLGNGGRLAAICAAPLVLGRRGLLDGKEATCFPGFETELLGAKVTDADFVTDGNITTGKGMEYSLPFAKELVRLLTN